MRKDSSYSCVTVTIGATTKVATTIVTTTMVAIIIVAMITTACATTENNPGHYSPITNSGIIFEFDHCEKVTRDIYCTFYMTADGRDTLLDMEGNSKLFDNKSKKYPARRNKIANKVLEITTQIANRVTILANSRTKALLIFYNFSEKATYIKRLEIAFTVLSPIQSGRQTVVFNKITIL